MKKAEEDRSYIRPVLRLLVATGVVLLVLPVFGFNTLVLLGVVSVVLLAPVVVGRWVRYKFFGEG